MVGSYQVPRDAPGSKLAYLVAVAFLAVVYLTVSLPSLPLFIGQTSLLWLLFSPLRRWPRRRQLMVVTAFFFAAVVASAYLDTRPLEKVRIERQSGAAISGDLVASSGTSAGTWYVGQPDVLGHDKRVIAVPGETVVVARTFRPEDEEKPYKDETLLDVILGRD